MTETVRDETGRFLPGHPGLPHSGRRAHFPQKVRSILAERNFHPVEKLLSLYDEIQTQIEANHGDVDFLRTQFVVLKELLHYVEGYKVAEPEEPEPPTIDVATQEQIRDEMRTRANALLVELDGTNTDRPNQE
jgi:Zn-dependent peptidase ImmA (M78 family)